MWVLGQIQGHAGTRTPLLGVPLQPRFARRDHGKLRHCKKTVRQYEQQDNNDVQYAPKHFFSPIYLFLSVVADSQFSNWPIHQFSWRNRRGGSIPASSMHSFRMGPPARQTTETELAWVPLSPDCSIKVTSIPTFSASNLPSRTAFL